MEKTVKVYHLSEMKIDGGETLTGDVVRKADYDELLKEHEKVVDLARTAYPPEGVLDSAKWIIEKFMRTSEALDKANANQEQVEVFRAREVDNLRNIVQIVGSIMDKCYGGKKIW